MSIDPEDAPAVIAAHKASADKRMRQILLESITDVENLLSSKVGDMVPAEAALRAMTRVANSAFETGCEIGRLEGSDILTAAQARSREDAEIMREVARALEQGHAYRVCHCVYCLGPEGDARGQHKPDCLVTKIRTRADELEGRTDG